MRIFWRSNHDEPVREFMPLHLLYGTEPGSYLAARTMHQIADDCAPSEEIARVLKNATYVDDMGNGCDSIEEARVHIQQLRETLNAA